MKWKYIKEIKDDNIFEKIEQDNNIIIPLELKEIIKKYNGGRPENKIFDTESSTERVMLSMISYNKEDKTNIYIYTDLFNEKLIPFAITPFGDVICFNSISNEIQLYLHEIDICEKICNSIDEFFDKLYNIED